MQNLIVSTLTLFLLACSASYAQQGSTEKTAEEGNFAIVIDERLSLLLTEPSLYSIPMQRLSRGRRLLVISSMDTDGITFYEVKTSASNEQTGWIQADAVVGNFRRNEDQRLVRLIHASTGFGKIERAVYFLTFFPESALRPSILMLLGDLVEEKSLELSTKASAKFDRREMAASGAPLHSFYLGYNGLDRYRKLGIRFLFNFNTRSYHYDGEAWLELVDRYSKSEEAVEAQKRLDFLREKMERK